MNAAKRRTRQYRVLTGKECANCGRRGKTVQKIGDKFVCSADDCKHESTALKEAEIEKAFNTPRKMKVFSWKGEIDTTMTAMDSIKYYKSFLQTGMMSMDPKTGYIKAWVGGINYKHFSYDHVQVGKRQVGSTFKPFVYTLAIQEGYSPCHEVPNIKYCFEQPDGKPDYCPKNNDGDNGCKVSLKYGLANSMNTITAWVMKQYGPQAVIDLVRKMGIKSHLEPVPSLCLGVADLSVYEIVGANSTFANKGVFVEPTFITRIEDKNGNVIAEFHPKTEQVMSEETAYVTLNLMKGVVDGVYNKCMGDNKGGKGYTVGSGMRIRGSKTESRPYAGIKYPMAGKTGTTQNNSDGWFIGLTPDLVTGVWVGADDRSVRFSTTYLGQGANTGLPIYGYYMNKIYEDERLDVSKGDFDRPNNPVSIQLNCKEYQEGDKGNKQIWDPFK
jgi:penicillin-binding protein 1A